MSKQKPVCRTCGGDDVGCDASTQWNVQLKIDRRCPECGGSETLRGRADVLWDDRLQAWLLSHLEDEIECAECGWMGSLDETAFDPAVA